MRNHHHHLSHIYFIYIQCFLCLRWQCTSVEVSALDLSGKYFSVSNRFFQWQSLQSQKVSFPFKTFHFHYLCLVLFSNLFLKSFESFKYIFFSYFQSNTCWYHLWPPEGARVFLFSCISIVRLLFRLSGAKIIPFFAVQTCKSYLNVLHVMQKRLKKHEHKRTIVVQEGAGGKRRLQRSDTFPTGAGCLVSFVHCSRPEDTSLPPLRVSSFPTPLSPPPLWLLIGQTWSQERRR